MEQTTTFGAFGSGPSLGIGMIAGFGLGMLGGIFDSRQKRQQDHQARAAEWASMQEHWEAQRRQLELIEAIQKPKWPPRDHPRSPRKRKG